MSVTAPSPQLRAQLDQARQRVSAARDKETAARRQIEAGKDIGDELAVSAAEARLKQARDDRDIATGLERQFLQLMTGSQPDASTWLENPEAIAELGRLAHSRQPIGRLDLGQLCSREQYVEMIRGGSWGGRQMYAAAGDGSISPTSVSRTEFQVPVPQLRRRLNVMDLVPVMTTEANVLTFVIESGPLDGEVVETPEDGLKPPITVDITDAETRVRTIAGYIKANRQSLDDVGSLSQLLTTRLTYLVQRRVEAQIINGDGTGENLTGILNTAGIGTVTATAAESRPDAILSALTTIELAETEANGIVLNPVDWDSILRAKTTTAYYITGQPGELPGGMVPYTLWGCPVSISKAMPAGTALVGDFPSGCTLYVREGLSLRTSDADQDDFLRNRVTFLSESRVAIAVWRPMAFCRVDMSAIPVPTVAAESRRAKAA